MSLLPADIDPASGRPVSQRDIARHFGVSHVTVSLALRDSTRVSAALRERIVEHAREVGYRRDPLLSALKEYRLRRFGDRVHGTIAWFNGWNPPERLAAHPAIARFRQGAESRAREHGFRLEEFRPGTGIAPRRLDGILSSRGIRGILLPPQPAEGIGQGFPWADYLVVSLGRSPLARRCHQLGPSILANLEIAVAEMRQRGYRRIGCIAGDSILRPAGYSMEECLPVVRRQAGVKLPLLDLLDVPAAETSRTATSWLREHRPDAMIFDEMETRRRLAVETTLPFATLDRHDEAGIDPDHAELGKAAARLLCDLIRDEHVGVARRIQHVAMEGSWRDGASLPQARAACAVEPAKE